MNPKRTFPLMAKVFLMLLTHLTILAIIFYLFVNWQLHLGLNSLLSGSTGDRLESLGNLIANDISTAPREKWDKLIQKRIASYKLTAIILPANEIGPQTPQKDIPHNILETLTKKLPPKPIGPPQSLRTPRPHSNFQPASPRLPLAPQNITAKALFLTQSENTYWAAIEIPLLHSTTPHTQHAFLFLKSETATAHGLFFNYKPWLLGGLGFLALSIILWAPFALSITRYAARISKATIKISAGKFDTKIGTTRNDELGLAGKSIEEMSSKIGELVTGQKQFLGDVSHELCAPLARIRTGLGILEASLPQSGKDRIASIDEDAAELSTLVSELLAFTKANSSTVTLEPINLHQILATLIPRELSTNKVTTEIPENTQILADKRLLIRALLNILRNCHRHAGPECEVHITAKTTNKQTTLTIADNGPGVPQTELKKLFQPFYRPDKSRTRDTGGTGLGMAIVETSIIASKGTVHATLTPKTGLTLTITLPTP